MLHNAMFSAPSRVGSEAAAVPRRVPRVNPPDGNILTCGNLTLSFSSHLRMARPKSASSAYRSDLPQGLQPLPAGNLPGSANQPIGTTFEEPISRANAKNNEEVDATWALHDPMPPIANQNSFRLVIRPSFSASFPLVTFCFVSDVGLHQFQNNIVAPAGCIA